MKFSELKGRAVVNFEDATNIGAVEDLMVQPESHHIVSVKVRTGMFHSAEVIPVTDVKNVGEDAVTISVAVAGVDITHMADSNSAEQYVRKAHSSSVGSTASTKSAESSQPLIEITSLLGNKVVTDAGTMVGKLRDVLIDWVDLSITGYEVHEGGMFTKAQEFIDTPDVHYGDKLITIPAQLLSHPN